MSEIAGFEEFHPRAVKLMRKRKNFLVVAEDEPYFMQVYRLIRKNEKANGTWSDEDERIYQSAQQSMKRTYSTGGNIAFKRVRQSKVAVPA